MKAAYASTIGEIRKKIEAGRWIETLNEINSGYDKLYHQQSSEEERNSWSNSIPALIAALKPTCNSLPILFEIKMPIGNERADIILLGGENKKRAVIIELKQWDSSIEVCDYSPNSIMLGGPNGLIRPNPLYQVDGYVGKISNYHSEGSQYEINGIVYLHNMKKISKSAINNDDYKASIFIESEGDTLSTEVETFLLPNNKNINDAISFANGEYTVSGRLVDFIRKHRNAIKERIYAEIAASGFSLCDEQLYVINQVLLSAKEAADCRKLNQPQSKYTFIVNGPPGSGKTLVALTLLIEALGQGIRAVYGLRRNGALVNTLRKALSSDISQSIYFINIPRTQNGIADVNFDIKGIDLILCDESQRMLRDSIDIVHTRAPVVTFFVDETQRLNTDEEGILENFRMAAQTNNSECRILPNLPAGIRCRGGLDYHNFVETLLEEPFNIKKGILANPSWGNAYSFKVFNDYQLFIEALRQLHAFKGLRVALVASWTESDGDSSWRLSNRPKTTLKNIRVGPKLQSGNKLYPEETSVVSWVMNPDDYRSFWSGESASLDVCASIYGTQGFESDVVGFIWGRDLVLDTRNNTWRVGDPHTSRDYSGGTDKKKSLKNLINGIENDTKNPIYNDVKTLLLNRTRIFLTRGILGTYIYAEDEITRQFLTRNSPYFT